MYGRLCLPKTGPELRLVSFFMDSFHDQNAILTAVPSRPNKCGECFCETFLLQKWLEFLEFW